MRRALLLLFVVSCGDPLVDADYRGEPILRLEGQITSFGGAPSVAAGEAVLVSMFWNPDPSVSPPTLVEQGSISTAIAFPNTFEVRVFEPPATEHMLKDDARIALGILLVYVDRNADGAFNGGDEIIGGALKKGLVWATEDVVASDSPFGAELPGGFSLIDLMNITCVTSPHSGGRPPPRSPTVRSCESDDMCPPDFTCDDRFSVCVPRDRFEIVIGNEFDLRRASCY